MHKRADVGSHSYDYISDDIGANNVVRAALCINTAQEVGRIALNVSKPRILDVLSRHLNGNGVDVVGAALQGSKLCGANSKYAATAAHVKHALAALNILLKKPDNEPCRFVRARTESHTGVHTHRELALGSLVLFPRGNDNYPLTYLDRLVVSLPRVRPVLLANTADGDLAVDAERRKALLEEAQGVRNSVRTRKVNGNGRYRLVRVKYALVNEVAVAGLEINIAVILDLKIVRDHTHDGRKLVKLTERRGDLYLRPLRFSSPILAYIILVHIKPALFLIKNALEKSRSL